MTNESNSPKWWQTLTGLLTATTAIITAVTGLLVALHQTGWLTKSPSPTSVETSISQPVESARAEPATKTAADAQTTIVSSVLQPGQRLAKQQVIRLGSLVYTLTQAELVDYNTENLALRITLSLQNNEKYPVNFWNQSFRLLVDSIPKAPSNDLNLLVQGDSAEKGELEFVVPKQSGHLSLRISSGDEKTEIKL